MENTRAHILEVGQALIAQRGFTAVGLSELLKTAKVPKGSFYYYFASKDAYGCALLERYVAQYSADLAHSLGNEALSGRERLIAYFKQWQDWQTSHRAEQKCLIVKLAAEISDLSPAMRSILQNGVVLITQKLSEVVRLAEQDGSTVPSVEPESMGTLLYQIWLGASLMAHLSQDETPFEIAMSHTQTHLLKPSNESVSLR